MDHKETVYLSIVCIPLAQDMVSVVYFNKILIMSSRLCPDSPAVFFFQKFQLTLYVHFKYSNASYISKPSHTLRFGHRNIVLQETDIMKLQ
jgi:hypothetical protein